MAAFTPVPLNNILSVGMKTIVDGTKMWAYGRTKGTSTLYFGIHDPIMRPHVCLSTDGGNTWVVQDEAHVSVNCEDPSNNAAQGASPGGIATYYHESARTIWFGYFQKDLARTPGDGNYHFTSYYEFQTFNLDTGLYSVPFGSASNTSGLNSALGAEVVFDPFDSSNLIGIRINDGILVTDDNKVIVFTSEQVTPSNTGFYDIQLYFSSFSFTYPDPTTGTWDSPLTTEISGHCPIGSSGSQIVNVRYLGGIAASSTCYFFYQCMLLVSSGAFGTVSYSIFYRTLTSSGTLGSFITIMPDTPDISVQIKNDRQDPNFNTSGSMYDLSTRPVGWSAYWACWISFQNVYIRSGNIVSCVMYLDSGNYVPAIISVNATTGVATYTVVSSGPNWYEATAVANGTDDVVVATEVAPGDLLATSLWLSTNPSGAGWSIPVQMWSGDLVQLPFPTYTTPGALQSTAFWQGENSTSYLIPIAVVHVCTNYFDNNIKIAKGYFY
jgi:hypothetical protein